MQQVNVFACVGDVRSGCVRSGLVRIHSIYATALKPPHEAGGRGGESTARQYLLIYIHRILAKQILLRSLKLELRISVNPLQYPSIWLLSM